MPAIVVRDLLMIGDQDRLSVRSAMQTPHTHGTGCAPFPPPSPAGRQGLPLAEAVARARLHLCAGCHQDRARVGWRERPARSHTQGAGMKMRVWLALLFCFPSRRRREWQANSQLPTAPNGTAPQKPFRVYGDLIYVGMGALGSFSGDLENRGDILIDGDLNESAPQIAAHIEALGRSFRTSS